MTRQPCVRIHICSFWKQIWKIWWCLSVIIVHQWLAIYLIAPLSDAKQYYLAMAYDTPLHEWTIRCEIMRKKDPKGKKIATMIWEYHG